MASKLPKSVARIPIPLYGGTVWFAQSIVDTQICASLLGAEPPPDGSSGLCYPWHSYQSKRILLVTVLQGSVPTLAHEMCHVTFNVLGYAGVPIENDAANESYCYLMGHLMQEALTHLKA